MFLHCSLGAHHLPMLGGQTRVIATEIGTAPRQVILQPISAAETRLPSVIAPADHLRVAPERVDDHARTEGIGRQSQARSRADAGYASLRGEAAGFSVRL